MTVQQVGPETYEMSNASVKMTLHEGRITSLLDVSLGCVVRLLAGYQADAQQGAHPGGAKRRYGHYGGPPELLGVRTLLSLVNTS